jgi:hypothetical protein
LMLVIIAALQLFAPSMQGCRKTASSIIDPSAHSQLAPQDAGIPNTR